MTGNVALNSSLNLVLRWRVGWGEMSNMDSLGLMLVTSLETMDLSHLIMVESYAFLTLVNILFC